MTGVLFKDGHGMVFNANNPGAVVQVAAGYVTFVTGGSAPPLEPRPATALELEQNVKATTTDVGASGGASGDATGGAATAPIEIFLTEPPPVSPDILSNDETVVVPPVTLIPAIPVDSTTPAVIVTGAPASITNNSSLSLSIVSTKPVTITYILNGVGIITPTGLTTDTFNVSGLIEGPQTLTIQATDAADNSSLPVIINWITDYTAPVLSFTLTPAALTNESVYHFSVSTNETVTYTPPVIDGSTFLPSYLSEGPHLFTQTATDAAGNGSTISYAWTTDYTLPALYFVTTPLPVNGLTTADFNFATDDPAALSYSLDFGVTWLSSSGIEIFNAPANFGEGPQILIIKAVDGAGNSSYSAYTWFYGARQYDLTGAAVDSTDSALLSASATGNLNLISTGTQGAWQLGLTGTYTGMPSNSIVAGGTALSSAIAFDGYWLDKLDLAAGTSSLSYLSRTVYGSGQGVVTGGYDGIGGFNAVDTGLGTYTETPLDFSGDVWGGLLWYDPAYGTLRYANAGYYDTTSNVNGVIGLVGDLWTTGSAQAHLMGTYNTYSSAEPYLIYGSGWYMNYDPTVSGYSTSLGGAFKGYNVGVWSGGNTKSNAVAIYIDPNGNAGILTGDFSGAVYPDINNIVDAQGLLLADQRATGYVDLATYTPADYWSYVNYAYPYGALYGQFAGSTGYISSTNLGSSETMWLTGQDWGIYKLELGGVSSDPWPTTSTTFSMALGESYWKSYSDYWLANISGIWNDDSTIDGTVTGRYLTQTGLGQISGDMLGSWPANTYGLGTWEGVALGEFTEVPLAHSGQVATDSNYAGLYVYDQASNGAGWLDTAGSSSGLMGGVSAPWSGITSLTYMGSYVASGWFSGQYLWTPDIYSYNVNNSTNTTFDNGMYKGFIGGIWKGDGIIDAKVYSLYIDPAGNAGILKGDLTGAYYPDFNMFAADGTWAPTVLTNGLDAATATVDVLSTYYGWDITSSGGFNGTGAITASTNEMLSATDWRYSISGQGWGVSKSIIAGVYTGTPSDTWNFATFSDIGWWQGAKYGSWTDGTQWSGGVLKGQTYGYGADITAAPKTWISVGETYGTFDAVALTWQAAQTSAFIETSKYLAMKQTTEGQAALTQLNIPFVEVGNANLSGSGAMGDGSVNVNMNNVTFLAYSSGAAPKLWATGDMSGGYTCTTCGAANLSLTGNGLNTNFNITTFDTVTNNNWLATVSGGGTYSGTGTLDGSAVQMTGAAAGIIDTGTSTFTGTAAGTAQ